MVYEKEIKELLYKLEDITALGTKIPLAAFPQLKSHLEKMRAYMKENHEQGLFIPVNEVEKFIEKHSGDYEDKDERAISRGFQRMKKAHPDRLDEWRAWHKKMDFLDKNSHEITNLFGVRL